VRGSRIPVHRAFLLCSAVLLLGSAVAAAGEIVDGSIGVTNDYVYRGISRSRGESAVQGDLRAHAGGAQVGVWASTLDHADVDEGVQVDGLLAYRLPIASEWQLHAQFTHTAFLNDHSPLLYDYDEVALSLTYQARMSLGAAWIPNAARYRYWGGPLRADAFAYDATWLQPLFSSWHLSLGAGYYDVSALYGNGYAYWHSGLVGTIGPFDIETIWIDTQDRADYMGFGPYGDEIAGSRWSVALRWRF